MRVCGLVVARVRASYPHPINTHTLQSALPPDPLFVHEHHEDMLGMTYVTQDRMFAVTAVKQPVFAGNSSVIPLDGPPIGMLDAHPHTYTHTHTHAYAHGRIHPLQLGEPTLQHTHTDTDTHAHTYTHTDTHTHTHTHTHMHTHTTSLQCWSG